MNGHKGSILVIGIGSEVLKDDGIGPRLVMDAACRLDNLGIDFITSPVGGMETIEMMRGYEQALIIDGILTGENPPGSIYDMRYPYHRDTLHLSNAHDVSFDLAMRLARKLNIPVPADVRIVGIEIIEDREFGEQLTEPLQERYDEILSTIVGMLKSMAGTMPLSYEKI